MAACAASCRRTAEVAKPDPTPKVDAAPRAPEPSPSRALLHGNVVELTTGAVVFPHVEARPPRAESAEIVLEEDETLRAIDLATGATRWKTPAKCRSFALSKTSVACAESASMVFVDRASGVATRVPKTSSSYSEPIVVSGEHFVALLDPSVVVYDARGRVRATTTPTPGPMRGFGERVLAPSPEGYCYVTEPPDYYVRCFDLDGKPVRATKLALTKPTDPPGTRMMPILVGPRYVVVGTFSFGGFPAARRSSVVRIADGAIVATVEDEVVALAERPDGTLDGLVVVAPEIRLLSLAGKPRWTHAVPYAEPFAAAASSGETLYLARYDPIATGVVVGAFRMTDGAEIWNGETKLPPIAHSKYRNDVRLELRPLEGAVVLRGDESSVRHVHLYDAKTGALRFHDAPPR
jgi:outer membrane protein assembly factor BamB